MQTYLAQAHAGIAPLHRPSMDTALARHGHLAKAPGSLGRLEALGVQLAGITANPRPKFKAPAVLVLVADHGVTAQGVSSYPGTATARMVLNVLSGGAAINAIAKEAGARIVVADFGLATFFAHRRELQNWRVAAGAHDFSQEHAMSRGEAELAVERGIQVAEREIQRGADLLALGEIGIGNTTSAAAITCALLGVPAALITGRGTGIDDQRLARKVSIIDAALARWTPDGKDPLDVLAKVGGFEIGGLVGAFLGASLRRVPAIVDGFVATAAALLACGIAPALRESLIFAHRSPERGHAAMLTALGAEPLLDFKIRLGEGSGAALAIPIVRTTARVLDEMSTFDEAGVTQFAR